MKARRVDVTDLSRATCQLAHVLNVSRNRGVGNMDKEYRERISASKARLDNEMRAYAATLTGTHDERVVAMVARFPAIDRSYAMELVA